MKPQLTELPDTLLERALRFKTTKRDMGPVSPDELDLAIAFLNDEISQAALIRAIKPAGKEVSIGSSARNFIMTRILRAIRFGQIKIVKL